jgi:hypothetical protein
MMPRKGNRRCGVEARVASDITQLGNLSVVQKPRRIAQLLFILAQSVSMKVLYPTSHEIPKLSEPALALKIARHSPCSVCTSEFCPGLRPPPFMQLVPDSDEDYDGSESYLSSCACGHDATDHGADRSEIGSTEFSRRGRVAVRLDELLQVHSLLKYQYK